MYTVLTHFEHMAEIVRSKTASLCYLINNYYQQAGKKNEPVFPIRESPG